MGLIVGMFQNELKSVIAGKTPSEGVFEKIKSMNFGAETNVVMDFAQHALSRPGADTFIRNLATNPKFVDALLEHAHPGYGITNSKDLFINVVKLLAKTVHNLGPEGYEPINKALADPKQREALLKALRGGQEDKVMAFIKGEAPEQMQAAKFDPTTNPQIKGEFKGAALSIPTIQDAPTHAAAYVAPAVTREFQA